MFPKFGLCCVSCEAVVLGASFCVQASGDRDSLDQCRLAGPVLTDHEGHAGRDRESGGPREMANQRQREGVVVGVGRRNPDPT
jgi:hypothetical protein